MASKKLLASPLVLTFIERFCGSVWRGIVTFMFWRVRESNATREKVAARTPGRVASSSWIRAWSAIDSSGVYPADVA